MLVKRNSITQHTRKIYHYYEEYIKKQYLSVSSAIAITQDAWTSPNNLPFMSITGHFITNDWTLMDITLGIAEIKGEIVCVFNLSQVNLTYMFEQHSPSPRYS